MIVNHFRPLAAPCGSFYSRLKDSANSAKVETGVAVIVPFESPQNASIEPLVGLVAADMERVNAAILQRTGSEVTMIPEVANHLISSGGKRLRPMLTLAMANLTGYSGDGHIKLAASVEFMHTATLLHDDVVDESNMRRGKVAARMLWGNEASVLVGDFLLGQAFKMMVEVADLHAVAGGERAVRGERGLRPATHIDEMDAVGAFGDHARERDAGEVLVGGARLDRGAEACVRLDRELGGLAQPPDLLRRLDHADEIHVERDVDELRGCRAVAWRRIAARAQLPLQVFSRSG